MSIFLITDLGYLGIKKRKSWTTLILVHVLRHKLNSLFVIDRHFNRNIFHSIVIKCTHTYSCVRGLEYTRLYNTASFQHFFTNRVVNCWNSHPRHVVSVDTINAFKIKNSLDRHLSSFMYDKRVDCNAVTSMKA